MTNEEKIEILKKNLQILSARQTITNQQKNLTVKDLAEAISIDRNCLKKLNEILSDDKLNLSYEDKISFCRNMCNSNLQKEIHTLLIIGSDEPTPAGAHSKISFIKNKYNDLAFERFSRFVPHAKADYATSFKECCENVTDGVCEYCILPITSSTDGRFMSFYSLLDRYELKICAVTDIEDEEASKTVRYACVGKNCVDRFEKKNLKNDIIFEFYTIDTTADVLPLLLLCAKEASAEIVNIDSIPVEYSSRLQKFFFSFKIPSQNSLFFRLLTAITQENYVPIGIYKEIL